MDREFKLLMNRSSGPFTPAALFGTSDTGSFYDPFDTASLFQLSTGTTPAIVDSPVGYITDKSGRGNHLIQATAGSRVTLRQSGALFYVEGNGAQFLSAILTGAVSQPSTMALAYGFTAVGGTPDLMEAGNGVTRRNLVGIRTSALISFAGTGTVGTVVEDLSSHILFAEFNGASSTIQRDAGAVETGNAGTNAVNLGDNLALFSISSGGGEFAIARFYGGIYIDRLLTAGEKLLLRTWLNTRVGL